MRRTHSDVIRHHGRGRNLDRDPGPDPAGAVAAGSHWVALDPGAEAHRSVRYPRLAVVHPDRSVAARPGRSAAPDLVEAPPHKDH